MTDGHERLFVYGSLRSDVPRTAHAPARAFRVLERGATLEGPGWVRGALYAPAWYPGFVARGEGRVRGEVWRVHDGTVWRSLDAYEGSDYRRELHQVEMGDGRPLTAWLYEYRRNCDAVTLISSGDYLDWISRSH